MEKAKIAYEAYRAFTGGKSLASGEPIPEWSGLREDIQKAWEAAAEAVVLECIKTFPRAD